MSGTRIVGGFDNGVEEKRKADYYFASLLAFIFIVPSLYLPLLACLLSFVRHEFGAAAKAAAAATPPPERAPPSRAPVVAAAPAAPAASNSFTVAEPAAAAADVANDAAAVAASPEAATATPSSLSPLAESLSSPLAHVGEGGPWGGYGHGTVGWDQTAYDALPPWRAVHGEAKLPPFWVPPSGVDLDDTGYDVEGQPTIFLMVASYRDFQVRFFVVF